MAFQGLVEALQPTEPPEQLSNTREVPEPLALGISREALSEGVFPGYLSTPPPPPSSPVADFRLLSWLGLSFVGWLCDAFAILVQGCRGEVCWQGDG